MFDAVHKHHVLLFSPDTFAELRDILLRPKFDRYSAKKRRRSFIRSVRGVCTVIDVATRVDDVRDPKDNKFIALAIDGGADYLITKDSDFLHDPVLLEKYNDINICSLDNAVNVLINN